MSASIATAVITDKRTVSDSRRPSDGRYEVNYGFDASDNHSGEFRPDDLDGFVLTRYPSLLPKLLEHYGVSTLGELEKLEENWVHEAFFDPRSNLCLSINGGGGEAGWRNYKAELKHWGYVKEGCPEAVNKYLELVAAEAPDGASRKSQQFYKQCRSFEQMAIDRENRKRERAWDAAFEQRSLERRKRAKLEHEEEERAQAAAKKEAAAKAKERAAAEARLQSTSYWVDALDFTDETVKQSITRTMLAAGIATITDVKQLYGTDRWATIEQDIEAAYGRKLKPAHRRKLHKARDELWREPQQKADEEARKAAEVAQQRAREAEEQAKVQAARQRIEAAEANGTLVRRNNPSCLATVKDTFVVRTPFKWYFRDVIDFPNSCAVLGGVFETTPCGTEARCTKCNRVTNNFKEAEAQSRKALDLRDKGHDPNIVLESYRNSRYKSKAQRRLQQKKYRDQCELEAAELSEADLAKIDDYLMHAPLNGDIRSRDRTNLKGYEIMERHREVRKRDELAAEMALLGQTDLENIKRLVMEKVKGAQRKRNTSEVERLNKTLSQIDAGELAPTTLKDLHGEVLKHKARERASSAAPMNPPSGPRAWVGVGGDLARV
mmetsp:Transcript_28547/g.66280  ORF Transcript_28547/g.66280 Transcript_28547/m.66280 type:complete len:607 (+) Transcript_28547:192-2012(+)|eukprot:CAMPEP_0182559766 /NCGR_PEP_ID=MMETSP1324-20130603/2763_1 /TAXON_ID=236786 /ORGANISM="Florenciella sp., Strain RCC1587" /LENGTH=606 /DNA_ID=CAMNT_0024772069 /DNA_START=121 /DNA_END=1941 /DNA_ORIENTATION=+